MRGRALLFGCLLTTSCSTSIPVADGGTCRVRDGLMQAWVLEHCGRPCGETDVPEGYCGTGYSWLAVCSNHCDVYADSAVCYSSGQVVDILPVTRTVSPSPCSW